MKLVIFGLSLSSSWGNGHAVTYRSLIKGLRASGHDIVFFERDVAWYAQHRDFLDWVFCDLVFYERLSELASYRDMLRDADAIIIGSYVPDAGILYRMMRDINRKIIALYDIDTPVTLADLRSGRPNVFDRAMIADCDLYLSFTGGPTLQTIAAEFSARCVRALYCSVDPDAYQPLPREDNYALSYLGTYSADRQPKLENLLFDVAQSLPDDRFIVGGAQFPEHLQWPSNVEHVDHVAPADHPRFYAQSRATLNLTRADMILAGYSPSIRLFEAASCATTILTDTWPGLEDFLTPGDECIVVETADDVHSALARPRQELFAIADAARARILQSHTGSARARELINAIDDAQALAKDPSSDGSLSEPNPPMHVE